MTMGWKLLPRNCSAEDFLKRWLAYKIGRLRKHVRLDLAR